VSRRREHLDKTLRALEDSGARVTSIEQRGHPKIGFETPDGSASLSISTTPSDTNAFINVKADIKRKVAELTALGELVPIEQSEPIEQLLPRVRQASWPARSKDRAPAFQNWWPLLGASGGAQAKGKDAR
jgi:hypothetical protein